MTESELEDHIRSKNWNSVNLIREGSQQYKYNIGVLRLMFSFVDDPQEVVTLNNNDATEVWAKINNVWNNLLQIHP